VAAGRSATARKGDAAKAGARERRRPARRTARPGSSSRPQALPFRADAVPVLRPPAKPACTFHSPSWTPPKGYRAALHIHGKAPPFAFLRGGAVRLFVSAEAGADAVVELDRGDIILRGLVRSDTADERLPSSRRPVSRRPFVLRPSRPLVLAGVVAVTSEARLGWRGAASGRLTVTLPDTPVRFSEQAPVELPCDDLRLNAVDFDHASLLPLVPDDAPTRHLQLGGAIRVASTADAKPVASLRPLSGDHRIVELGRTDRRVKVFLERPGFVLFGWVKRRHLAGDELAPLLGAAGLGLDGLGEDGLGALPMLRPNLIECSCPADVSVIVDMSKRAPNPRVYGANYAAVGRVPRGRTFRVERQEGPLWELRLAKPIAGLSLSRGRLAVSRDEIEACEQRDVR